MSRRSFQFRVPLAFLAAVVLSHSLSRSQAPAPTSPYTPFQHRALYLFNFAKYTEWPKEAFPTTNSPFVLGILGPDPFLKDIEIIAGKSIKNRKLVVQHYNTAQEAAACHLLFIGYAQTNGLAETLKALEHSSVLTIGELDGFIQCRGMINLVVEQKAPGFQTIGFQINQAAAEKARLKIDPQLLKLAKFVQK